MKNRIYAAPAVKGLTAKFFIWNFQWLGMQLCLADATYNVKWVTNWQLFRFDKIGISDFEILLIDVLSLTCSKDGINVQMKTRI